MPSTPALRLSKNAGVVPRNKTLGVFFLLAALCIPAASADQPAHSDAPSLISSSPSAARAPLWNYRVTGRSEQSRELFTQGFVFDGDTLWISSGLYQQSHVIALDRNNAILHKIVLPAHIFGEGMTIARNQLWVLSWREQRVLRYDLATQKPRKTLRYNGEGWGLTFDGKQLIRSDGSSTLYFHRTSDFRLQRTLKVTDGNIAVNNLNELEWIDGLIYANVWLTNSIVIIDPANGHVSARLDLAGLLPAPEARSDTDVLNGIAWNVDKKELWVTGKRWPARFRLEVIKPATSGGT